MSHNRDMAAFYDARARAFNVDPPRSGRKTYSQRYSETSSKSSQEIRNQIASRGTGSENGVAHQVLADREE